MLFQLELAGCVSEELYEKSIPPECSLPTARLHAQNLMLCYGLMAAINRGERQDCSGCDVTKVEQQKIIARIEQRKAERAAA